MKKALYYFSVMISLILFAHSAEAQYYFYNEDYYESALTWELGFSLGAMNCLTDLGGGKGVGKKFIKDVNWDATRPSGSIFAGLNYKDVLGVRLELAFGQVKANDDVLVNDRTAAYGRYLRNLNFRSDIKELSLLVELYPLSIFDRSEADPPRFTPYIFAGAGCYNFNPESFYNKTWIDVSDLHTEGQGFEEYPDRKDYKLTQFNLPFGLGVKYEASPVLAFKLEITYRKLWTDYLDDVSTSYIDPNLFKQYFSPYKAGMAAKLADRRLTRNNGSQVSGGDIRGNSKHDDTYFSGALKIALILGRQRR